MRERAPREPGAKPDPNDLPTTWSESERDDVLRLSERILADWKRRADAGGRRLAVLYVPRGNDMLTRRDPRGGVVAALAPRHLRARSASRSSIRAAPCARASTPAIRPSTTT